ncbi:phosphopantetheine-binding protein [Sphaerisporangium corydalis]|uniref:Phosphopantetheine-binding protein n=1 Tax=Sphaerisporangium corydalis TaxID=1441875 RepID=A0ABV9EEJ8_9ACTN|nr:phosphopantetheine-binding protein [Sphaerisporangium corydalis]
MGDAGSSIVGKRVERIWKDVLGVSRDEMNASFSELGGRGMTALRIVARIQAELGVTVEVGDVLDHPHLADFVRHVVALSRRPASPDERDR